MTPTRYNKIIDSLFEEGHNLADLCRYDAPVATICYRGTFRTLESIDDLVIRIIEISVLDERKCMVG